MYILSNLAARSSCDLSAAFPLKKLSSFILRRFILNLFKKFFSVVLEGLLSFWSSESSSSLFDFLRKNSIRFLRSCCVSFLLYRRLLVSPSSVDKYPSLFACSASLFSLVSSALRATDSSSFKRSASFEIFILSDVSFVQVSSTSDNFRWRLTIFLRNSSSSWLNLAKIRSLSFPSELEPTFLDVADWNRCHHHPTWSFALPDVSSSSGRGSNLCLPRKHLNELRLPLPSNWSMFSSDKLQSSLSDSWSASSSTDRLRP